MATFLILAILPIVQAEELKKLSVESQNLIKEKREKISTELENLKDHPWAGVYYMGDGLGTNVTLHTAPENGFTIVWRGCMGLYDQNHGEITEKDGFLELKFAWELEKGYTGNYATEYFPLKWGERLYMLPKKEIVKFCNAVNSYEEPRKRVHGSFLLRRDDWEKPVESGPDLPEKYRPYLLAEPVDAKIVSVEETHNFGGRKRSRVIVDKGKNDGLLPGMELHVLKPDSIYEEVFLIKTDETQSEGWIFHEMPQSLFSSKVPLPKKDWELSTCPHWRRASAVADTGKHPKKTIDER